MRPAIPIAALLVAMTFALAPASAQTPTTDQTPGNTWIEATFDLTQPDLSHLDLAGELIIREYTVNGDRLTADEIAEAYLGVNRFSGKAKGDAFIADVENDVAAAVKANLARTFPAPATVNVSQVTLDRTTLKDTSSDGNEYAPGIRVTLTANVVRELDLGTLTPDAVIAVFDAGATIKGDMALTADTGYAITYTIHAPASPAGLAFSGVTGATENAGGASITATVSNLDGNGVPLAVTYGLQKPAAVATAPPAEDIDTTVEIHIGALESGKTDVPLRTDVVINVYAVDVDARMPGALPSSVSLRFLSADALRALRATGALSDGSLGAAEDALRQTMVDNLGNEANVDGGFVAADLAAAYETPYRTDPPVRYIASSQSQYTIDGDNAEHADLALRIGAALNMNVNLFASETRDNTFVIHAPEGTVFEDAEGITLGPGGRSASLTVPASKDSAPPVALTLRDPDAPLYVTDAAASPDNAIVVGENGNVGLGITLDLKDLDISIGKAIGGDLGGVLMKISIRGDLGVIRVPEEMRGALGDRVSLEYLSSDAIRLLLDRGLVKAEDIDKMEKELLDQITTQLSGALGGNILIKGGFDRTTLAAALVGDKISGEKPIVFEATTSILKPISGGPPTQAALALYTAPAQTFQLPRVQGQDTTYKFILPAGLALADLQVSGGEYERGTESDGRDSFTVKPTDETATASVAMSVTAGFVIAKFWPVLLLAIIVLFALIGTPIAIVALRRRKAKQE